MKIKLLMLMCFLSLGISKKGVCWNTTSSSTINDFHTNDGTGLGAFTSSLTQLASNTTYFVKADATNALNTNYETEVSSTIPCATPGVHLSRGGNPVGDYCTIQAAVDASQDGDVVNIDAGTYTEQVTITKGITLQGAGRDLTIIESPDADQLAISGGNWKNLKDQDMFDIIGIKTSNDAPVTIKDLKVDGRDQGFIPYTKYDTNKGLYDFHGIGAYNTTVIIDNVYVTGIRSLASQFATNQSDPNSTVPPGYLPTDQPAGINHNDAIFAESVAGVNPHTFTLKNSYITKFQKTAVLVWGPTLTVDINNNTIQGYGQTLWSTGNGIQVASSDRSGLGGANGDRSGTKGSVKDNQILDIGLVIPEPGQPGSYLNLGLYSPAGIILYVAGDDFEISGNTITRSMKTKSWHVDYTSTDGGYGSMGIDVCSSKNTIVSNNTIDGFDEAIATESVTISPSIKASANTVSNNTIDYFLSPDPNEISLGSSSETLTYLTGSPGNDVISNFGLGDKIQVVKLSTGVVNGMLGTSPSVDYSAGTVTVGHGTNVAPYSVQIYYDGTQTYLYIDTDGTANQAELILKLNGEYITANFLLDGAFIKYQYTKPGVHLSRGASVIGDYRTIQAAVNASQDGDVVNIDAGTYTEQVTITKGITLQGAGRDLTIIESPDADLLVANGGWKTLKNQDVIAVVGIKTGNNSQVVIKDLTIDGSNQGYQPDQAYPDKMAYAFQGIGAINTNLQVDNVKVTRVRALASDYSGTTLPAGYLPTDQPSGMNHNDAIFAESAAGAGEHTLEISNTYIDKFQKDAILAWGPTLTVNIHNNTIQGYGKTLWSTGNGIQVASSNRSGLGGANGDRRGTKGVIKNNQILDIGLVIPEPGQDGSYLNLGLLSPSAVLLWEAGDNFEISGNTITRNDITKSWHVDFTSEDGGYGSMGIGIISSTGTIIRDNTISGFDEAITADKYQTVPSLVVSNNVVLDNTIDYAIPSGPSQITLGSSSETLTYLTGSPGNDVISNFGLGDKIQVVKLSTGVVNGMLGTSPSVDYSTGTVTEGDGTNVSAYSVQFHYNGTQTYLYIDTDGIANPAELTVKLNGQYNAGNFLLAGSFIKYQYTKPEVSTALASVFDGTSATLGGTVTFDGGTSVTERGIVYNTTGTPTITDPKVQIGSGSGSFSRSLTGLDTNTTYYARAYAINSVGISYGEVQRFETTRGLQTITFNQAIDKTYGDADFTPSVTASSGLTVSLTTSDTKVAIIVGGQIHIVGSGTCTIYADQEGNDVYSPAPQARYTFVVKKATLTVAADNKSKVYGSINPSLTFSYTGWKNSDTEAVLDTKPVVLTTVDQFTNAGTYSDVIVVSGGVDNNYAFSYKPANFVVTKAALTVTANSLTKGYGEANPMLTFTYSGWLNSETESVLDTKPTISTTVDRNSFAGVYANAITVSGGADNNYDFAYVAADFNVTKAHLTITASAQNKEYDGNTTAIVSGEQLVGVLNGDVVSLTLGSASFEDKNVGTDKIVTVKGSSISGPGADNYLLPEAFALKANITPKQLTVANTVVAKNKMFDNTTIATIEYVGTLQGLAPGDENVVDVSAVANYNTATIGGDKTITTVFSINGGAASNYLKPVDLIITGAKISEEIKLEETMNVPVTGECQGEDLYVGYHILSGTPVEYRIIFNAAAHAAGFVDTGYLPLPSTQKQDNISLNVPSNMAEGVYLANLQFRNELHDESPVYPFEFTIKLSKNYLVKKFDDVIVCDNSSNRFTTYQWYKNGQLIPGATEQFYNDPEGIDGLYSLQVSTKDGVVLWSCDKEIHATTTKKATISAYPSPAKSSEPFTVRITDLTDQDLAGAVMRIYSITGALVQTINVVTPINTVTLPMGEYLGTVITSDQKKYVYKITVVNL
jgi:hypothetical protein